MQCLWLAHVESHSPHVVEHSGYGLHVFPCEHHPQPSSSLQPHTLLTIAHVSTHFARQVGRHEPGASTGHSRHVVVH